MGASQVATSRLWAKFGAVCQLLGTSGKLTREFNQNLASNEQARRWLRDYLSKGLWVSLQRNTKLSLIRRPQNDSDRTT